MTMDLALRDRYSGWRPHALMLVCWAFLGLFLIWPVALVLSGAFVEVQSDGSRVFTTQYIAGVFADPVLRDSIANSLLLAAIVTLVTIVMALPLSLMTTRYEFAGKRIIENLLLLPIVLPPFVGAIGLRHLFGRFGGVNSLLIGMGLIDPADPIDFFGGARFWGVVFIEALHLYPIIYLNLVAVMSNLDPSLEQAAEVMGASPWMRLRRIVLPLSLPGLFAGGTIVFIWSFTELGTPLMFDFYRVAPVQIMWGVNDMTVSPRPYALVVVMLLLTVILYLLGKFYFGRAAWTAPTRAMTQRVLKPLRGAKALAAAVPFGLLLFFAILPHIGVILASLSPPGAWYRSTFPEELTLAHYAGAIANPLVSDSIRNSILYATLATAVDVVLGIMIAYLVVRAKPAGARLLDALAMMPLAIPGLVMAFGYVAMSLKWPMPQLAAFFTEHQLPTLASLCQITGRAPNPALFLIIAYAVRRLPFIVRSASAGLEQVPIELEDAAKNLGGTSIYTLRRIVLPLIVPSLIAGALLTFSFAMLEVSDSLILAQAEKYFPITKAIYTLFKRLGDGPYVASALGVWSMTLLGVTLVGAAMLLGKRLGALFRA